MFVGWLGRGYMRCEAIMFNYPTLWPMLAQGWILISNRFGFWWVCSLCHPSDRLIWLSGESSPDGGIGDDLDAILWTCRWKAEGWIKRPSAPFTWRLWIGASKPPLLVPKPVVCVWLPHTLLVRRVLREGTERAQFLLQCSV